MVFANPMVRRPQALVFLTAFLSACAPAPEFPPPPQKQMPVGDEPLPSATFIRMSGPAADAGIVQEIVQQQSASAWRWTNQHPRVKVWVHGAEGWNLHVKFTLPGVTLKQTGPITIRFGVNDHILATQVFGKEQQYEFVKAVPPEMLNPEQPNFIALDLDRVYVSPNDGVKLGILLQEIGLKRAGDQ